MTEAEAYAVLDWEVRGNTSKFVLPISNSTSTDWEVRICDDCGMRGMAIREHVPNECVNCHKPQRIVNAKVEITKL